MKWLNFLTHEIIEFFDPWNDWISWLMKWLKFMIHEMIEWIDGASEQMVA